jgi:NADH-quinone oxidoreductase subunit N
VLVVLARGLDRAVAGTRIAFGGMFVDDGFARFAKVVILLSAAAVLLMGQATWRGATSCGSNTRC